MVFIVNMVSLEKVINIVEWQIAKYDEGEVGSLRWLSGREKQHQAQKIYEVLCLQRDALLAMLQEQEKVKS